MKTALTITITVFLAIVAFSFTLAKGADVTLEWDRNDEPEVTAYRVYYGNASGSHAIMKPAGNETHLRITDLTGGATYYFTATALNAEGLESLHSNEVVWTAPASPIILTQAGLTLTWTDSRPLPPPPLALTCRLEWAGLDGQYVTGILTTGNSAGIPALAAGPYTFRVVPINSDGTRGEPSNALPIVVPSAPPRLRIKVALQVSTDLETWETVFASAYDDPRIFARATITTE